MFTEQIMHEHPTMIKALMGIPADLFWEIVNVANRILPEIDRERLARPDRQRQSGAGRAYDQPIALRVAALLTYLRLHAPQIAIGVMYGVSQTDISRDLRRLLPAIQKALPCPEVWKVMESGQPLSAAEQIKLEELADGRVLVDATEQRVSRAKDNETRKKYYSGKKKQFTIKTQLVTDGEHHIRAISEGIPGSEHDKALSDELHTLERLPDGCEAELDKGYQGVEKQIDLVTVVDPKTGEAQEVPRLTVKIPYKKPKKGELTEEQCLFNAQVSAIRVRVEHCIGWVKNWAILANRFRCAHSIYTSIMRTICGLVNLQTETWQTSKGANSA
jgi:hypothetical protein